MIHTLRFSSASNGWSFDNDSQGRHGFGCGAGAPDGDGYCSFLDEDSIPEWLL